MTQTITFTHGLAFADRASERCFGKKADGTACRTLTRQAVTGGGLTFPACGPHAAQVTELAEAEYAARTAK